MRKLTFILFLAIVFASCGNDGTYTITGDVPIEDFEGNDVMLLTREDGKRVVLHMTPIRNGSFKMKGHTDSPFVGTLMIDMDMPYFLPVAVEPGKIYVQMGYTTNVRGTEMNDKLQDFMLAKDAFSDHLDELPDSLSKSTLFNTFIREQVQLYANDYPQLSAYIEEYYPPVN